MTESYLNSAGINRLDSGIPVTSTTRRDIMRSIEEITKVIAAEEADDDEDEDEDEEDEDEEDMEE